MSMQLLPLTEARKKIYELSKAIDSAYEPRQVADGLSYLPFQKAGIEFGVINEGNILLGDEPGVGKTVQAIGIANELRANKILIVCPAKLINVWVTHIKRWFIGHASVDVFHPKKKNDSRILISSYYWLSNVDHTRALKKCGPFDVLIIDECHLLKEVSTKRTKHTYAANGLISVCKKVIALSGTALVNRPMELYATIKALKPEVLGHMNKFGFGVKYCAGWQTPWGTWDFNGASNLKELGLKLRASGFMIRRRKADVLKELPEKFINIVYVDETDGVKAITKLESYDAVGKLQAGEVDFTEISSARKELGLSKVQFVFEYIQAQLETGHEKIIVFAHHKDVVRTLTSLLDEENISVCVVTGQTSNEDIEKVVAHFQGVKGRCVFIGSIQASGVGLTLTAASYVIFAEFSWVPGENSQAMDRAHRIGQRNSVVVDFIVHKNSLDERVLKFVLEKEKVMGEFYE